MNSTYSHLYGFTPLTRAQIDYYIKMYISMLNLDFLNLVVDESDELIGMGVVMPSLSKALQKAQGRLFPFGFIHLIKALKTKNPVCDFLLIAVRKDYQNKGVNAVIFNDGLPYLTRAGAKLPKAIRIARQQESAVAVGGFRGRATQARRAYAKARRIARPGDIPGGFDATRPRACATRRVDPGILPTRRGDIVSA